MYHSSSSSPAVVAAGALCWRERDGAVEVLVIHRPKYDDWSWPKGKQDPGETIPETALREVREEVGLRIALGPPLATTSYRVSHGMKDVYYWAAEVPEGTDAQPDDGEVDSLRWVSVDEARTMLTNSSDTQPLDRFVELLTTGDLRTRQLIVVRHAKAKPRSSWSREEGERPLAATGKRQAIAVGKLLEVWKPRKVISSPWVRCMQTVAGYAKTNDIQIKEKSRLTEAEHKRKPGKVTKLIDGLFDSSASTVVCTHRPVLPTVLKVLNSRVPKNLRRLLPTEDPFLSPGEMLILNISRKHKDRVISIEQVRPADD